MQEDITLRAIQIDEKTLMYSLERKNVKNINLHVRKNGSVYVSANMAVPAEKIDAFLVSKAGFILNAQKKFALQEQYKPQPKQYISGFSSIWIVLNVISSGMIKTSAGQRFSHSQ